VLSERAIITLSSTPSVFAAQLVQVHLGSRQHVAGQHRVDENTVVRQLRGQRLGNPDSPARSVELKVSTSSGCSRPATCVHMRPDLRSAIEGITSGTLRTTFINVS